MCWIALVLYILGTFCAMHDLSREGDFVGVQLPTMIILAVMWPIFVGYFIIVNAPRVLKSWFDVGG
jgi:hypothetical protein